MYLSDSDGLYRELEALQRASGRCAPLSSKAAVALLLKSTNSDCRLPDHKWGCDETIAAIEFMAQRPPTTRCESLLDYFSPGFFAHQVSLLVDGDAGKLTRTPRMGTLRLGDINYRTLKAQNSDDFLVLINPDLGRFALEVIRYVLNVLDVRIANGRLTMDVSPIAIGARIRARPELAAYFRQTVADVARGKSPPLISPDRTLNPHSVFASPEQERVATGLIDWGTNFFVAHEYAHALLKHTFSGSERLGVSGADGIEVDTALREQALELEADREGLRLWAKVFNGSSRDFALDPIMVEAPVVVMASMALVELELTKAGLGYSKAVPSTISRIRQLRKLMRVTGGEAQEGAFSYLFARAATFAWAMVNGLEEAKLTETELNATSSSQR